MSTKWIFAIIMGLIAVKDWFGEPPNELHILFRSMLFFVSLAAFCILSKQDDLAKKITEVNPEVK